MKRTVLPLLCAFVMSTDVSAETAILTGTPRLEAVELALEHTLDRDGCIGAGVVDLPDIHFDFDSAVLRADAAAHLDIVAQVIRRNGFDHFVIEGHTDGTGTNSYNWELSRRRAESVGNALRERGVAPDALSLRWYGEERLRYPDRPDHPYNRRVTLLRIGPNSALYDAASDSADLSVRLMALPLGDGDTAYVQDPGQPMATGTWFFLCVAARVDGYLEIEHRRAGEASFSPLGAWRLPGGALARAPEHGTLRVTGQPGVEELRLVHVSDTAACHPQSHVPSNERLERVEIVDGQPLASPTTAVPTNGCACSAPGVTCSTMRISHQ